MKSIVKLLLLELNYFFFILVVILTAHPLIIVAILFLTFTIIFFCKLDQIEVQFRKSQPQNLTYCKLQAMLHHYRTLVLMILKLNSTYSKLMVIYLVALLPLNLEVCGNLLLTESDSIFTINFAFLILFIYQQFAGIFGFHLLCAIFTQKIHRSVPKRLIHYDTHIRFRCFRNQLTIALNIERFHTRKQYGITYGKWFGLITTRGFVLVSFKF